MKVLRLLFFFFGFLLPLSTIISNGVLIAMYITLAVLFFQKKSKFHKENIKLLFYSTLLLFLICVLSLVFAEDTDKVLKIIERRVAYLLTPLIFLFVSFGDLEKLKIYSLNGLFLGSFCSALILLIKNFTYYYATRPFLLIDNELFNFYHTGFEFTDLIGIHPSYLGMYFFLALAYLLFFKPFKSKIFMTISFLIILSAIIFLASRVVYVLMALLFVIFLWIWAKNLFNSKSRATICLLALLVIIGYSLINVFKNTYLFERTTKEAVWELSHNINESYNTNTKGDSRLARWSAALELIYEKPIIGYGVGAEKDKLEIIFHKKNMLIAANKRYDAHNQYLSYILELGVVGLLLFVFYLGVNLFYAIKARDFISSLFVLSIALIGLVENFFNNNAGITFIAFFGTVFLFSNASQLDKQ